jgi:hypothetical protein
MTAGLRPATTTGEASTPIGLLEATPIRMAAKDTIAEPQHILETVRVFHQANCERE